MGRCADATVSRAGSADQPTLWWCDGECEPVHHTGMEREREKGTLALVTSQRSDSLQFFPGKGERDGCHFEGTPETDWGARSSSLSLIPSCMRLSAPLLSLAFTGQLVHSLLHCSCGTLNRQCLSTNFLFDLTSELRPFPEGFSFFL